MDTRHKRCFLCRSLEFCPACNKCPNCCSRSTCTDKATAVLGNLGNLGDQPKGHKNPQRRLHQDPTKFDKVTNHHKLQCQSSQEPRPYRGIFALLTKNAVDLARNQKSLEFFNQPNNRWRPILDLSNLNQFLKAKKFKMETPETIQTSPPQTPPPHPPVHRFQGCLLPYSHSQPVQEVPAFSHLGSNLPIQQTTI